MVLFWDDGPDIRNHDNGGEGYHWTDGQTLYHKCTGCLVYKHTNEKDICASQLQRRMSQHHEGEETDAVITDRTCAETHIVTLLLLLLMWKT